MNNKNIETNNVEPNELSDKNISVIIPTLQKNRMLLDNLVYNLEQDKNVDEIIIIDNSLKGLDYESNKIRIITPNENLFVNPSWNLGVKLSKNNRIALLNDDITVPENFCSNVFAQFTNKVGVVGCDVDFVVETQEILPKPQTKQIRLKQIPDRCTHWGAAIFFNKAVFVEIPEELKIFYGDNWIIFNSKKQRKGIYSICGQEIYHYGSLSSASNKLNSFSKIDEKIYKKLTTKWWQKIFSIEPLYKGFQLMFLGIKFVFHYSTKR